jgi:hypothetical protein
MTKTNKIQTIIRIALIIIAIAVTIPAISGKNVQAAAKKNGLKYDAQTKTWNLYKNGKINKKFTGLVQKQGGWFYVKKGRLTKTTGIVKHTNNKYYYVQGGKVNNKKTGYVKKNGKTYYVNKGVVDFNKKAAAKQTTTAKTVTNTTAKAATTTATTAKATTTAKAATTTAKVTAASAMPSTSNKAATTSNTTSSKNRLIISSVGINVGIHEAPINNLTASQKIVDAADSAALMNNGYQVVVADHVHQGFTNLKNVKVGATAVMNGVTYRCTLNTRAYNKGNDLVDVNTGKGYYYSNKGGLTVYTCVYNSDQITLTQWVKA